MPERYRVVIMPEASAEMTRAFEYIERDSPQNAAGVVESIFAAIDSLEHLPHRCKVHRSNRNPARVIRSLPVPPFIVYYRIAEADRVVGVITVRHGARRQPRSFR
jgi:toxin ParE1/3/4